MMKDFKLGVQLLKYAYGRKGAVGGAAVLFLLAFPVCIANMLAAFNYPGGYFFLLAALMLCQGFVSLYASDLVMASPARKRLEISVFTMMQFVGLAVSYLMVLVVGGLVAVCSPEQIGTVCRQLILTSVAAVIVAPYMSASRKYFIASTIAFCIVLWLAVGFFVALANMGWWLSFTEDGWRLFAGTALMGTALILCSGGLVYLINLVLYKVPMSKLCQTAGLRKSL